MIEHEIFRLPRVAGQGVLAVFSYRYDAHLVADLLQNIRPFVDGYVAYDDRKAKGIFTSEPARRSALLNRAKELGARWILAVDPDERFEIKMSEQLPQLIADRRINVWSFYLREMFSPNSWRSDGIWGQKAVSRLFRIDTGSNVDTDLLHGDWIARDSNAHVQNSQINLYHLRCAHKARRKLRRQLYASQDPSRKFQRVGYDYIDDERGMELQAITPETSFSPAFVEDRKLWAAREVKLGKTKLDPLHCKLGLAGFSIAHGATAAASFAVEDVVKRKPNDDDLREIALRLAAQANRKCQLKTATEGSLSEQILTLDRLVLSGKLDAARLIQNRLEKAAAAEHLVRYSAYNLLCKIGEDFGASDAMWRRWMTGHATLSEGSKVSSAALTVIIISFKSQATVLAAVQSILSQESQAEVVVVNSGGGPIFNLLSAYRENLRIIDIAAPLKVGAARNIGVDASRASYIAFLAADCIALPGWVEKRVSLHDAGQVSVSNPVETDGDSIVARAASQLRFWSRQSDTKIEDVSHFGRSVTRQAFHRAGYFPMGLSVGEDTYHNQRLDAFSQPHFARDIITLHRDPASLWRYCIDEFKRGRRRALHAPYRNLVSVEGVYQKLKSLQANRLAKANDALKSKNVQDGCDPQHIIKIQRTGLLAERTGLVLELCRLRFSYRMAKIAIRTGARFPRLEIQLAKASVWFDRQNAERHYYLGTKRSKTGNVADKHAALSDFQAALALSPHHFNSLGGIALILEEAGETDVALRAIEEAALRSASTLGYVDMACEMAFRAKKYDVALVYGRKALAGAPDRALFHRRLANIHIVESREKLARLRLTMAANLENQGA